MWDKLEVIYEGTNQVKESKINLLWREYELFFMKPVETISSMNSRFSKIVNSLKNLGNEITEEEMVKKILISLSKRWETKVTVLCEVKNLKEYSYDELVGSLLMRKMMMKGKEKEKETTSDKKKRSNLALKISSSSESSTSSEDEDDLALFIR